VGKALSKFAKNPGDADAVAVLEKYPMLNRSLRTTCVTTMLKAGREENSIPSSATATVNCRIFPGETIASVQGKLAELVANKKSEIKILGEPVESPVSATPQEVREALNKVLAVRAPGATVIPYMEAGATDGMHFRRAGIPTLGLGGLIGSSDVDYNFHANNERLPVAHFNEGLEHFYLFIKALTGRS
jgi:acetylornithine deacetylase/succinyl-diaminopimelate desuccinylase-like protein